MKRTFSLLLVVLALATAAKAQVAADSPPALPAEAALAYKQAVAAALQEYELQHFEEARSLFQRAHAIDPNARTLRGLGMVEFELRHYVRAAELLEESLRSARQPLTPEQRAAADELLTRTRLFIGRYTLDVRPAGQRFEVELDGRKVELSADQRLLVEAGEHSLLVRAAQAEPHELHLDAQGGEERTLRIELTTRVSAPAVTPPAPPPLVEARRSRLPASLIWAGGGVAALGGGLGVTALLQADGAIEGSDQAGRAKAIAIGADVSLGVGIALVVTGVVLHLVRRDRRRDMRPEQASSRLSSPVLVEF